MLRTAAGPVMGMIYDLLVSQQKKSIGEIFRTFINAFFLACLIAMVTQQIMLFGELRAQKVEEYDRAFALYSEECPYTRSSPARLKECSDLKIIINSWPTTRAFSHLVKGWNTCLIDLAKNVTNDLSYRIVFVLLALAITNYVFNFFKCFKKKSKEWTDKYRCKETNKAALASLNELLQKQGGHHIQL